MSKKFTYIGLLGLFLFSCGGGPASYDVGVTNQSSRVVIDMCKRVQEDIDNDGELETYCVVSYSEPLFSVTLSSKMLQDEFDDTEKVAYQVSECRFSWTPLNEWSPYVDVSNKFSCNYPSIPANGEANLTVSISQDLLEDMKYYYDNVSMGKPLSYLLEVTIVVRPYYGGEEREIKTYMAIDFNDVADEQQ